MELFALFFTCLLAATFFPFQSELLLAAMLAGTGYSPFILVVVATLGNVLGSVINWLLGRYLVHFQYKKWFPIKQASIHKAQRIYQKYGVWTLLLAWMPFIGDPLTLVAGIMRTRLGLFLLLVTAGKAARYIAVAYFLV